MSRKLLLSFSVIFVLIPFLSILLFGSAFISEAVVGEDPTLLTPVYSTLTSIGILGVLLSALYFLLFALKIDKTPDVKWLIISTFLAFNGYLIFAVLTSFETLSANGTLTIASPTIVNALIYVPVLIVPFLLIAPIFGFSKLYLTYSSSSRGRIVI